MVHRVATISFPNVLPSPVTIEVTLSQSKAPFYTSAENYRSPTRSPVAQCTDCFLGRPFYPWADYVTIRCFGDSSDLKRT